MQATQGLCIHISVIVGCLVVCARAGYAPYAGYADYDGAAYGLPAAYAGSPYVVAPIATSYQSFTKSVPVPSPVIAKVAAPLYGAYNDGYGPAIGGPALAYGDYGIGHYGAPYAGAYGPIYKKK